MDALFAKPVEVGATFMCAGGVGGQYTHMRGTQEETPPTGQSIRRASRGHVVTSPTRQAEEAEECFRVATATMAAMNEREQSKMLSKSKEDAEMEICLSMLKEDGVEEGTNEHYMAMTLFREHVNHFGYMKIARRKARIGWITFMWSNGIRK